MDKIVEDLSWALRVAQDHNDDMGKWERCAKVIATEVRRLRGEKV